MRATPMTPEHRWTRRKKARPAEILDAALKVFAQKGYAAASVSEVSRVAGVTIGALYGRFENKEALLEGLFDNI